MTDSLTLANLGPAIIAAAFGLMAVGAAFHATRGTRALRRRRRAAAARGEAPDAALEAGDLARARALADALVRVLRAAERQPPDARAAE